jgi:hypothetical protein
MRSLWTLWVAVQLALVAGLWLRRADHTTAVITVPVPYVVHDRDVPVEVPAPPPMPIATTPTCPAPMRVAPVARPELFPAEELAHVTTAFTDARWIAAWNDTHVFVTKDGGRTFARVLDGPGTVTDVAFDCRGDVLVLRDRALGIHADTDRWVKLDWIRAGEHNGPIANLVGGGPDTIVLGASEDNQARLAISSDLGTTWTYRDLTPYYDERRSSGRQDPDGTIRVATAFADCMSDPMQWYVISHGEVSEERTFAEPGSFYARGDVIYGGGYWRKRFGGDWKEIAMPSDRAEPGEFKLLTGPVPRVLANRRVYRLADGVATSLGYVEEGIALHAVDAAGRLWGLDGGRLRVARPQPIEALGGD